MSLAETQQIMTLLQEIIKLLDGVEVKTTRINTDLPRTKEALATFRQLERLALRWLTLSKSMGLPEDVGMTVDKIAQLVVALRMYQMSINMALATNPLTAGVGIAGILLTTTATFPSLLEGY